jgi:hypothetical protein
MNAKDGADASMNGGQTVPMGALPQTLTGKWPAATRRTTKCDSVSRSSGCKLTPSACYVYADQAI